MKHNWKVGDHYVIVNELPKEEELPIGPVYVILEFSGLDMRVNGVLGKRGISWWPKYVLDGMAVFPITEEQLFTLRMML